MEKEKEATSDIAAAALGFTKNLVRIEAAIRLTLNYSGALKGRQVALRCCSYKHADEHIL